MSNILGFDIGGSSVKAILVEKKEIKKSLFEDLPENLDQLLDLAARLKNDLAAGEEIAGAGFALAGALDKEKENMLASPNIKFLNNQPLKKLFAQKLNCPVKIEHDARCFILAEKEAGCAKNLKNIFYLTLGTGIGGALMIDGKIIQGAHGSAGEAGHMIIDSILGLDWEKIASIQFIKKCLGIDFEEALKRAEENDAQVQEVFSRLGRNLGLGISGIINTFDPEAVIISGGLARAGEYFLAGMKENIEKYVLSPEAKKTDIIFSDLGRFGGALGAAMLI
ncbi:MAG: Transcriptional repressor [Parcubacteria group bacterium GW2011_GWC1_43_12]|nr:MAG: Transcriptional repressor [Parcubacteria group bacterium GW2011_GWB1_42_6]KKS92199.1 MAG: Transcriptional repressor [Parcubacteria group bacterium GW2011_GWC1_43_12]